MSNSAAAPLSCATAPIAPAAGMPLGGVRVGWGWGWGGGQELARVALAQWLCGGGGCVKLRPWQPVR